MRVRRTSRFELERARFRLRFLCDDCGHFDRGGERCRHEWPNAAHREQPAAAPVPTSAAAMIDFCKEFELC